MSKKSFATCYDKNCEKYAAMLMTLVSKNKSICNIDQQKEVFQKDRSITSNEYVLTIGPESSKNNMETFKDTYNKYGIHIGYHGRKAWISCEAIIWYDYTLKAFRTELLSLLEDLGMRTDNMDDLKAEKNKEQNVLARIYEPYAMAFSVLWEIAKDFCGIQDSPKGEKKQYMFAVALFYHKYLNEFLELNHDEEQKEDIKKNF